MTAKKHMYGKRPAKRVSMSMVGKTGIAAPSWTPADDLSALANECFRAMVNRHAKPDLIRVFRNSPVVHSGTCYIDQRIITIDRKAGDAMRTLAHEIAHLRFRSHGVKHKALTNKLYEWLMSNSSK